MSKAKARRERPSWNMVPPKENSPGYLRVLFRGCGGYWSPDTPSGPGEFSCGHDYTWACEECPIGHEASRDEEARMVEALSSLQGPPRRMEHPEEYWLYPAVESELWWLYTPAQIQELLERAKGLPPPAPPAVLGFDGWLAQLS